MIVDVPGPNPSYITSLYSSPPRPLALSKARFTISLGTCNFLAFSINLFNISEIKKPTLIIYGSLDKDTPLYMAQYLHKKIENFIQNIQNGEKFYGNRSSCYFAETMVK